MDINWTVAGLVLDILGFLIVFQYGGFNFGEVTWSDKGGTPYPHLKSLGAIFIVLGFVLQILGALQ